MNARSEWFHLWKKSVEKKGNEENQMLVTSFPETFDEHGRRLLQAVKMRSLRCKCKLRCWITSAAVLSTFDVCTWNHTHFLSQSHASRISAIQMIKRKNGSRETCVAGTSAYGVIVNPISDTVVTGEDPLSNRKSHQVATGDGLAWVWVRAITKMEKNKILKKGAKSSSFNSTTTTRIKSPYLHSRESIFS